MPIPGARVQIFKLTESEVLRVLTITGLIGNGLVFASADDALAAGK
jgi:hypothetical protein